MGFGSYDESEQREQHGDEDDEDAAVMVHQHDHDGELTVENADSTDELLGQLKEIKANDED